MGMTHLVFVYGTLRKNESNHFYLDDAEFIGNFTTPPNFALFDLGRYPAIIEGKQSIVGEVYAINDDILEQLDRLEDIPIEYRRESINTPFGLAWAYLYQDTRQLRKPIGSGDWCLR